MSKSKRTISGRTVVITGAASGIGRALARRLSAHGCAVAIADIDEAGLKETADLLNGPTLLRVLDVRDAEAQRKFAAEVREWAPTPIAAVFNNAGVAVAGTVLDGAPEDDQWLWDINFGGVINGTRAFLPIVVEQGDGVIVNTSSVYGLMAVPNQSAYCAAKFAVRGYTDSLRHELRGTGVTAISVHPGGVNTNIVRNSRIKVDPNGPSKDELAEQFAAITMTEPDKAAEVIHRGVEQGKARILIGPDAFMFDKLSRIAPASAYNIAESVTRIGMTRLESLLGKVGALRRRRTTKEVAAK